MPDDDWALGQNEVDVRNEARRPANALPIVYACKNPEQAWIEEVEREIDLAQAGLSFQRVHQIVRAT